MRDLQFRSGTTVWCLFDDTNTMERVEVHALELGDTILAENKYWRIMGWPAFVPDMRVWTMIVEEEFNGLI